MKVKQVALYLFISFIFTAKIYYIVNVFKLANFSEESFMHNADAGHYCQIAKNICNYQTYSDNNSIVPTEAATWRPPIWPLVLSTFFYISAENPFYILVLKIVFEFCILLAAVVYLKRRFKSDYWCLLFLLFIEPQYLKYSVTLLSESLTALLILIIAISFLRLNTSNKTNVLIPVVSGITVLTHPVSAIFIFVILSIYLLNGVRTNFKTMFFHGLIFVSIVSIWPIRNYLTFDKGLYLTASQGATFSKGWNEKVLTDFTNVDGDLADEEMNLKYIKNLPKNISKNAYIDNSKRYKKATINFINTLTFNQKVAIVFKKWKSNFNPFPEKPKAGFFESLSVLFRILYLVLFIQLIRRLLQYKKFNFGSNEDKAYLIVLSILVGQIIMAAYIYTGFRFNAIYSLCFLLCFFIINQNYFLKYFSPKAR